MGRLKRKREEIERDIALQEKECCVCNIRKPFSDFFNYKNKSDGKSYRCKTCDEKARRKWAETHPERAQLSARGRTLKCKYGLTLEEYYAMLEKQQGCGICGIKENNAMYGFNKSLNFSVDHCHKTGRIRGLLCNQCNRGLGMLGDSKELLEKAIEWLTH